MSRPSAQTRVAGLSLGQNLQTPNTSFFTSLELVVRADLEPNKQPRAVERAAVVVLVALFITVLLPLITLVQLKALWLPLAVLVVHRFRPTAQTAQPLLALAIRPSETSKPFLETAEAEARLRPGLLVAL
jgi:hypothetical protein